MNKLLGVFFILHGLVHLWYAILSLKLVAFKPDMGFTGESWLLSRFFPENVLGLIATVLFSVAAIAFVVAGISLFAGAGFVTPLLIWTSVYSSIVLILFWDGSFQFIVQKGLIGLLINAGIIIGLVV